VGKQPAAVKLLLDKGAPVDGRDRNGATPLLHAALDGNVEIMKLLLEGGAKADVPDNDRSTPLMYAAQYGHLDAVNLLLEKGAAVGARADNDCTPLILAEIGGHTEVIKRLRKSMPPSSGSAEDVTLRHLIEKADSDGFASLRGAKRKADAQWESVTAPYGAQDCVVDWKISGSRAHAELRSLMLVTTDQAEAQREFMRIRNLVASVVPTWKDARRAAPAEDSFRIFFEPHEQGKVLRTVVVRYDKRDSGAYFVQLQIDSALSPATYQEREDNARNKPVPSPAPKQDPGFGDLIGPGGFIVPPSGKGK
jgi:hypothetical protein